MYAEAITTQSGENVVKVSVAGVLILLSSKEAVAFAIEILTEANIVQQQDLGDHLGAVCNLSKGIQGER